VLTAIREALAGRPSAAEAAWIDRIERKRAELGGSSDALQITDFGAGRAHTYDDGTKDTQNVTTRTLGEMTRSSKPPPWAYLLFRLARELRPDSIVELGACVGISASYQAAALELNDHGRLVTLEGADVLAERSARTLSELGLDHRGSVRLGRFADTLGSTVEEIQPVGIAFIDGHHVESATLEYMEQILPFAATEAVLVFDDVNWSEGMRNAWRAVQASERFALTVDLRSVGLAVVSASATTRQSLTIPYR
jgi:predicted O-methyltransferase YrrM